MKQRIVSALIALPLLLTILFSGNQYIIGVSLYILSLIGCFELYKSFNNTDYKLDTTYKIIGYIGTTIFYIVKLMNINVDSNLLLLLYSIIIIGYSMISYNNKSIGKLAITILSVIYIPYLFSYIFNIYTDNRIISNFLVGYVFIIAFGSDTVACLVGKYLGKRKVTPVLSPNKSLEGFIGGVLGSIILTLGYTYLLVNTNIIHMHLTISKIIVIIVFAALGAMISQIGDLLASAIKRTNGIKDYGNLMPGHGGVLDRFDSILMVAPFVYYFLIIFQL